MTIVPQFTFVLQGQSSHDGSCIDQTSEAVHLNVNAENKGEKGDATVWGAIRKLFAIGGRLTGKHRRNAGDKTRAATPWSMSSVGNLLASLARNAEVLIRRCTMQITRNLLRSLGCADRAT